MAAPEKEVSLILAGFVGEPRPFVFLWNELYRYKPMELVFGLMMWFEFSCSMLEFGDRFGRFVFTFGGIDL